MRPAQRFLVGAGILLLLSGLFHVIVWLASGAQSLVGPVTWRKPIEFGISGAVSTLALAWVLGRLPRSGLSDWTAAKPRAIHLMVRRYMAASDEETWKIVASGGAARDSGSNAMTLATSGNDS